MVQNEVKDVSKLLNLRKHLLICLYPEDKVIGFYVDICTCARCCTLSHLRRAHFLLASYKSLHVEVMERLRKEKDDVLIYIKLPIYGTSIRPRRRRKENFDISLNISEM